MDGLSRRDRKDGASARYHLDGLWFDATADHVMAVSQSSRIIEELLLGRCGNTTGPGRLFGPTGWRGFRFHRAPGDRAVRLG